MKQLRGKFKEKNMSNNRMVNKLHAVFDIMNFRSILLPSRSSVRVQLQYDAGEDKRDFTILSSNIPEDTRRFLTGLLKDNVSIDRIIHGLDSNNLEYADLICRGA
jgi:hypothetical protein